MSTVAAAASVRRSRVRLLIVAMLFLVTTVNYADRATLSIAGTALAKEPDDRSGSASALASTKVIASPILRSAARARPTASISAPAGAYRRVDPSSVYSARLPAYTADSGPAAPRDRRADHRPDRH